MPTAETPTALLAELLERMFSAPELEQFISSRAATEEIGAVVQYDRGAAAVAFDTAEALVDRNLVDDELWDALRTARPARVADINAVAVRATREGRAVSADGHVLPTAEAPFVLDTLLPFTPEAVYRHHRDELHALLRGLPRWQEVEQVYHLDRGTQVFAGISWVARAPGGTGVAGIRAVAQQAVLDRLGRNLAHWTFTDRTRRVHSITESPLVSVRTSFQVIGAAGQARVRGGGVVSVYPARAFEEPVVRIVAGYASQIARHTAEDAPLVIADILAEITGQLTRKLPAPGAP